MNEEVRSAGKAFLVLNHIRQVLVVFGLIHKLRDFEIVGLIQPAEVVLHLFRDFQIHFHKFFLHFDFHNYFCTHRTLHLGLHVLDSLS